MGFPRPLAVLLVPVVALAVSAAGAGVATAAPDRTAVPTATAAASRTYVALGDSYAAGYGLPAPSVPTWSPVPACRQTSLDYPHQVATALHLALTDVTCSGAVTADLGRSQPVAVPPAPAPQLAALQDASPALVSLTIGGNDLGFTSIAQNCIALSPRGPLLAHPSYASCRDWFASTAPDGGAAADPYARLPLVADAVLGAVRAVRRAAPGAQVVVTGYPAITPDAAHTPPGGCFAALAGAGGTLPSALPFTDVDVPYLQVLEQRLDAAIARDARAARATYASVYLASLAHSACAPESTRWVEPIVPGGGGTNVLHPSLAGAAALARAVLRASVQG